MKRQMILLAALVLATSVAMAAGEGKRKEGAKKVAGGGQEMTLTGKIMKFEKQVGKVKGKMIVSYYLFQPDGFKVQLPEKSESVTLDDFVDKNVEVVVLGVSTEKNGVREVKVTRIVSAKLAESTAAAATNAPAAAPKGE